MGSLPRFAFDNPCVKCGARNASAFWFAENPHNMVPPGWPREEHIQRSCRQCSYRWFEAPLDAEATVDSMSFDFDRVESKT